MKLIALIAVAGILGLQAPPVRAADYEVTRSLQLPNSVTEVWNEIGDFCDLDDWHPAFKACSLKVIDGRLHRILVTVDGAELMQKRIATEPGLSYTYTTTNSKLPIENYVATFFIEPNDGSLISWSGRFSSDDPEAKAAIAEIYETGLDAIEKAFTGQ